MFALFYLISRIKKITSYHDFKVYILVWLESYPPKNFRDYILIANFLGMVFLPLTLLAVLNFKLFIAIKVRLTVYSTQLFIQTGPDQLPLPFVRYKTFSFNFTLLLKVWSNMYNILLYFQLSRTAQQVTLLVSQSLCQSLCHF